MFGEEGVNNNNGGGDDMDDFDPFGGMFGGFGRRRRERERRVPDLTIPLSVSLEMLYNGGIVEVMHKKRVICDSWSDCEQKCARCGGRGIVIQTRRVGPGFVQQIQTHCPKCGGTGKITNPNCKSCANGQFEEVEKPLLVDVERGMKDGHLITFEGETDEVPDHQSGNINFEVDCIHHDRFERRGDDLFYKLWITLSEALVGVTRRVRQLDGRLVDIKTDSVIAPGDQISIPGEGMPTVHGDAGSMIVEFWVKFPKKLSADQKKDALLLHGERPTLEESGDGVGNSSTIVSDDSKDEL